MSSSASVAGPDVDGDRGTAYGGERVDLQLRDNLVPAGSGEGEPGAGEVDLQMRLHRATRRQVTIGRGPQAMTMSRTCSTAPSAPPGAAGSPSARFSRVVTSRGASPVLVSRTVAVVLPDEDLAGHRQRQVQPLGVICGNQAAGVHRGGHAGGELHGPSRILPPGRTCGSKWIRESRSCWKKKLALLGYWLVVVAKPITSPVWFMISVPIGGAWVSCLDGTG